MKMNNRCNDQFKKGSDALDAFITKLETVTRKKSALTTLKDNITVLKKDSFPDHLRKLKEQYANADLNDNQWENFKLNFQGNVEQIILDEIANVNKDIKLLTGDEVFKIDENKLDISFISENSDLSKQNYNILKAEQERLIVSL